MEHFHRDQRIYSDTFPPAVSIYWCGVEWSGGGWGVITVYMDFVGGGRLREREQSAGGWLRDRFRGFTK